MREAHVRWVVGEAGKRCPTHSLIAYKAASTTKTPGIMTIIAATGVLSCSATVYYIFSGNISYQLITNL